MIRSFLFVPAYRPDLCRKALGAGADAVVLDLEDAVPPGAKPAARKNAAKVLEHDSAWIRVNEPFSEAAIADLGLLGNLAAGIRAPKVESPEQAAWVVGRAGGTPVACAIESARGLLASAEIASVPGVRLLTLGGVDLRTDLGADPHSTTFDHARAVLVVAARAAGLPGPIDSVCVDLQGDDALRDECVSAKAAGYSGKSAIHPRQLAVIHAHFSPSEAELAWARTVLDEFARSGGAPVRLASGEFVDLPVAQRATLVLERAEGRPSRP